MAFSYAPTSSQSAPPGKTFAFRPEPSTNPCVMGRTSLDGPLLMPSSFKVSLDKYARIVNADSSLGAILEGKGLNSTVLEESEVEDEPRKVESMETMTKISGRHVVFQSWDSKGDSTRLVKHDPVITIFSWALSRSTTGSTVQQQYHWPVRGEPCCIQLVLQSRRLDRPRRESNYKRIRRWNDDPIPSAE